MPAIRGSVWADSNGRPAPAPVGTGLTSVSATAPLILSLVGTVLSGAVDVSALPTRTRVLRDGALVGTRGSLNLIPGGGVVITATDNPGDDRVDVELSVTISVPDGDYGDVVISGGGTVWELEETGVTPGTYGGAANVPQITVDAKGRVTAAVEVPISGFVTGSGTDRRIPAWSGPTELGDSFLETAVTGDGDGTVSFVAGLRDADIYVNGDRTARMTLAAGGQAANLYAAAAGATLEASSTLDVLAGTALAFSAQQVAFHDTEAGIDSLTLTRDDGDQPLLSAYGRVDVHSPLYSVRGAVVNLVADPAFAKSAVIGSGQEGADDAPGMEGGYVSFANGGGGPMEINSGSSALELRATDLGVTIDGGFSETFSVTYLGVTVGSIRVALVQPPVVAVTATASPQADESTTVFTNAGDTDGATVTLPSAKAGLGFEFHVVAAQTFTITAGAGDTIRIGDLVTAAAGSVSSATPGSVLVLRAINATEWRATSVVGAWAV